MNKSIFLTLALLGTIAVTHQVQPHVGFSFGVHGSHAGFGFGFCPPVHCHPVHCWHPCRPSVAVQVHVPVAKPWVITNATDEYLVVECGDRCVEIRPYARQKIGRTRNKIAIIAEDGERIVVRGSHTRHLRVESDEYGIYLA